MTFIQASWDEPLIYEIRHSAPIKRWFDETQIDVSSYIPKNLIRTKSVELPDLPEVEVSRHYTRLSRMNFSVDLGTYPLGSCTMKYNPKIGEILASLDEARWLHPLQDESTIQGALEIIYKLSKYLEIITGTDKVTLQPAAGAHGELTGVLIIRAYHEDRGEDNVRNEIIVPDSAHGSNPASATMAGFKVITIPTGSDGNVDLNALKAVLSNKTAGFMITNPNTLGLFEKNIIEISKMVHDVGGLMYYDGANLNGILGIVRPGDMGFDIVHLNLHKTFATPHGSGGPGAGAIGVKKFLIDYLPVPTVEYDGTKYKLNYDIPKTIGAVHGFYGNFLVFIKALAYIEIMGEDGLKEVALRSTQNTNRFLDMIKNAKGVEIPYDPERPRKHECAISLKPLERDTGVKTLDVAKRLLDYGLHPPTIYFPLIVDECMLIEFTETESDENIKKYASTLLKIIEEAYKNPQIVLTAPHNTSIGRLDEAKASHPKTMALSWKMFKKHEKENKKS
ncbi:MAG: aminomethyl-transferring glycine dehydrogenase subunit GcvPB [Thermoprotei archaeon]